MPDVRSILMAFAAMTMVGGSACAPSSDAGQEAEMAEAATTQTASADELTCFLRGATLEEAAGRPSPLGETLVELGDVTAKLCYGAPSARGREIMGGLVPYGTPWRMGANEATAIHSPVPLEIGGVPVPAGSHSLYAIPGESEWQIVVNGAAERWGVPINDEVMQSDLGSFSRPAATTDETVETLNYVWESHGADMGHLVMEWEDTRVEIPIHRPEM